MRRTSFAFLAAALTAWPAATAAQLPDTATTARPSDTTAAPLLPDTARYRGAATSVHPRGTVVSIAVRIPAGSAADPEGFGGTAWLLGHVLAGRAEAAAGPGTTVWVEVSPGETLFTIVTLPEDWFATWSRAESVLFGTLSEGEDVEATRESLLDDLAFDRGSPVRQFDLEAMRLIAPRGHPWSRSSRGTVETVANLSLGGLRSFAHDNFRADATTVAVVGPRGIVSPLTAEGAGEVDAAAPDRPAWLVGERFDLVQDITNSWIAVAWPVAPDVDRTSVEFLAHLLDEQLDPAPPDPDRYSLDVHIRDTPGGFVLLVQAAVFPEAADRWETRILSAVERLADRTMDEDFLGWRRRRFRTARLLRESRPEVEAARIARDLARDGVPRALSLEIWGLDAEDLHRAAGALGEPRILRLGPDLGAQGSRQ